MGKLIGVGLLVSYRISTGHYTLFLGRHKDVLTAIGRRRPEAARRMMERLLSETRGLSRHPLRGRQEQPGAISSEPPADAGSAPPATAARPFAAIGDAGPRHRLEDALGVGVGGRA